MSHMDESARVFALLQGNSKQHYIEIRRGKLVSLRIRMSEATDLADSLVDLVEQQEAKAEAWRTR